MEKKVSKLLARFAEVEEALGQPDLYKDQQRYRTTSQEHAYLLEVKKLWEKLAQLRRQLQENTSLLKEQTDPEFVQMLKEDNLLLEKQITDNDKELSNLLIPPNPDDHRNTIMELRAGTGGDEAALFVGDCVRMYKLYADHMGWRYELLSCTPSEIGGFKEYVMVFSGSNVHRLLQYEAGTHRVQRVPETEAQGRVHTSAITIAVLLEPGEQEDIELDEKDLRIDTYRSSGAGGQHVNTTDSAVRITHLPTGEVAWCQQEKSQHKNKEKAMRLLKAKIVEAEQRKLREAVASTRAAQVGSGDRSERIRTYNFSQNRVTEHRINLTKYNLDQVMEGNLNDVIEPLVLHFYQEKLESSEQESL